MMPLVHFQRFQGQWYLWLNRKPAAGGLYVVPLTDEDVARLRLELSSERGDDPEAAARSVA